MLFVYIFTWFLPDFRKINQPQVATACAKPHLLVARKQKTRGDVSRWLKQLTAFDVFVHATLLPVLVAIYVAESLLLKLDIGKLYLRVKFLSSFKWFQNGLQLMHFIKFLKNRFSCTCLTKAGLSLNNSQTGFQVFCRIFKQGFR